MLGIKCAVGGQFLHGLEAAPAGDLGKALAAILIGLVGSDDKVLQQSEGGNRVLERGVSLGGRAVILRTFSGRA